MTLVGYLDKHSRLEWRQYINYKSDFPAQQNQKNQTKKKQTNKKQNKSNQREEEKENMEFEFCRNVDHVLQLRNKQNQKKYKKEEEKKKTVVGMT